MGLLNTTEKKREKGKKKRKEVTTKKNYRSITVRRLHNLCSVSNKQILLHSLKSQGITAILMAGYQRLPSELPA